MEITDDNIRQLVAEYMNHYPYNGSRSSSGSGSNTSGSGSRSSSESGSSTSGSKSSSKKSSASSKSSSKKSSASSKKSSKRSSKKSSKGSSGSGASSISSRASSASSASSISSAGMSHMPPELRIPIGQWDVSRVTDFESVFDGYELFNEDLSGWDVSNAVNMDYMFAGCTFLNQSFESWTPRSLTTCAGTFKNCTYFEGRGLNAWGPYLGNVEYMSEMFEGCANLDTPLDRWRTDSVIDMSRMFRGCERFRSNLRTWMVDLETQMDQMFDYEFPPDLRPRVQIPAGAHVQMPGQANVATEIHEAVAKVNFEKLIPYLRERVGRERPVIIDYKGLVYKTMAGFVEKVIESKEIKKQQMVDLRRIMAERLDELEFLDFSPTLLDALYYAIEFTKQQPLDFIAIYVANFITDCVHAYANGNSMSCSQGVIERTFMTLGATCERISVLMPETDYLGDQNQTYSELANMITATPMFRIPDLILDWYKAHRDAAGLPTEITDSLPPAVRQEIAAEYPGLPADKVKRFLRRRHLKQALLEDYPEEEPLIEKIMTTHSNIIGYNNDNFTY